VVIQWEQDRFRWTRTPCRAISDLPTALLGLATLAVLLQWKKVPERMVILVVGVVGFVLKGATG
jgi:MFS superfamily sulfate permease-like transporter